MNLNENNNFIETGRTFFGSRIGRIVCNRNSIKKFKMNISNISIELK